MNGVISESSENYLEVIYDLAMYNKAVRLTDVAKRMNVSKASVNKAMGVLKTAGLVLQQHYGSIELTEQGIVQAQKVMERHDIIRRFFSDILSVDYETADKDACRIEHVVSEKTMKVWSEYINKNLENKS